MRKIFLCTLLTFFIVINICAVNVSITMNSVSRTMTLAEKGTGTSVDTGTPTASYQYTFDTAAGDYILTGYNSSGVATGTMEISVFEDGELFDGGGQDGKTFKITTISAGVNVAGWTLGTDYQMECSAMGQQGDVRAITTADGLVSVTNVAVSRTFMMQVGDSYRLTFGVSAQRVSEGYVPTFNAASVVTATSANATTSIPLSARYAITVPDEANLYVGGKWGAILIASGGTHYTPFLDQTPVDSVKQGGKKTYTYSLARNGQYNFRVSQPDKLTQGGKFLVANAEVGGSFEVTSEMLSSQSPQYLNPDPTANQGANESDIFLNINAEGQLVMKSGQTHALVNLRRWQLTDNSTNNYFIEPDYHYTITGLDGQPNNSVIEIDKDQIIRAKGQGTVIVRVTYDAINVKQISNAGVWSDYYYGSLWSAILPENTGTFVVTVDEPEDPALKRDMGIREEYSADQSADAELDVFYYLKGAEGYSYKFKPEGVGSVSIANPALETNIASYNGFRNVTANEDGSYTLLLTKGRNIVKLTSASGASIYQILTAKPVSYEISNTSNPGLPIQPGDQVKVQFEGFYHPANKLAGIYNQSAYVTYNGIPNGTSLILSPNQYQFCGTPSAQAVSFAIPKDWDVTTPFMLEDGALQINGFGSVAGKHRAISPITGINPNFTASVRVQYFGSIPDVAINVTPIKYFKINFEGLPENAVFTVSDKDGNTVSPVADGSYEYSSSYGSYNYTASCNGYQVLRETFKISDESPEQQTITVPMKPLTATDWDGITMTEPAKVTSEESNTAGGQFEGMEGYYKITGGAELAWFANVTNTGQSSYNAVMANDINLSNFDWTRIGNSTTANQYSGTFDGGGFTVDGLYINATSTYQGLFGYINAATIRNLTVQGSVKNTQNYTGGIVAYSTGNSILENCHNEATVFGAQFIGGVLSYSAAPTIQITSCSNSADITGQATIGGVVGAIATGTTAVMNEVSNTGNITATTATSNVGGIIGNSAATAITNAFNQGNINGANANIGGISGNTTAAAVITNAYNSGSISTSIPYYTGGAIRGTVTLGTLANTYAYDGTYDLTAVTVKTTGQFASGEVAWLLGSAFGQNLGEDSLPVLGGAAVYRVLYTNNLDDATDTLYTNGTLPLSIKEGYATNWLTSPDGETVSEVSSDSTLYVFFATPAASVSLNEKNITLEAGSTYQLTATVLPENATNKNVTWTSSDSNVAIVDTNGLITAIAAGTATITVTTEDGEFTANCSVTVTPKTIYVASVNLNATVITIKEGEAYQLIATVNPVNATNKNVAWTSSDNSIVRVNPNGLVTAISAGTATIITTTEDGGYIATCAVTVNADTPTGINDVNGVAFSVYPNPFVNYIIVNTTESGTATICDLSGRVVLTNKIISGSNTINTFALPKGIYLLKTGEHTRKIVK